MRTKVYQSSGFMLSLVVAGFLFLAFSFTDTPPNFEQTTITEELIDLSTISSNYTEIGFLKTQVDFQRKAGEAAGDFYGQEIHIQENELVDRIFIGIRDNLVSRIELWKNETLVEAKEVGFVGKMTWGETQKMSIEFYDQTNEKYRGQSKISMSLYKGGGFLGDIATINMNLTTYGDFSKSKKIGFFAKSFNNKEAALPPVFTNFKVWKNYANPD